MDLSFWEKVNPSVVEACWEWTGAVAYTGSGVVRRRGKLYDAHRYAYELAYGPVPSSHTVIQVCDNPLCCNPGHLMKITKSEERKRLGNKGRVNSHIFGEGDYRELQYHLDQGITTKEIILLMPQWNSLTISNHLKHLKTSGLMSCLYSVRPKTPTPKVVDKWELGIKRTLLCLNDKREIRIDNVKDWCEIHGCKKCELYRTQFQERKTVTSKMDGMKYRLMEKPKKGPETRHPY